MIVFCAILFSNLAINDLDQLITDLGASDKKASVAISKLKASGNAALPALIARMSDGNDANRIIGYQESTMRLVDGKLKLGIQTIGRACFLVAREQLEAGPSFRADIHFITPENIKQWFETNKGLTLNQMQINVLKKTLQLICSSAAKDGLQDSHINQMNRITNCLTKLEGLESKRSLEKAINDLDPNSAAGIMIRGLLKHVK